MIFTLFYLFAISGLFEYIESNFYNPRIQELLKKKVHLIREEVDKFHDLNLQRFEAIISNSYIYTAYLSDQTAFANDINQRIEKFKNLKINYPDFLFVRLLDPTGKKIHFSTLQSDIMLTTKQRQVFKNLDQVDKAFNGNDISCKKGQEPFVTLDDENDRFIYSLPIIDNTNVYKGTACFYYNTQGLANNIYSIQDLNINSELEIVSVNGIIVNQTRAKLKDDVKQEIIKAWGIPESNQDEASFDSLYFTVENKYKLALFSLLSEKSGEIGLLVLSNQLEINDSFKIILSILMFLTLYLLLYLILNIKQDPMLIVSNRIKHFQMNFLKEFIEAKDEINWSKWQHDLTARGPEIKKKIKKGIGKTNIRKEKAIDDMINKSWDEILTVFMKNAGKAPSGMASLSRIEQIIKQALKSYKFVNNANKDFEPVEELDEVEEIEETGGAPHGITEEVEDLEEVEEIIEEVSPDSEGAVEDLEEVEEVVEEIEEIESADEVETAEEIEELSAEEPSGAAEIEEAEEFLEEVEEVEETAGISRERPVNRAEVAGDDGILELIPVEDIIPLKVEKLEVLEELVKVEDKDSPLPSDYEIYKRLNEKKKRKLRNRKTTESKGVEVDVIEPDDLEELDGVEDEEKYSYLDIPVETEEKEFSIFLEKKRFLLFSYRDFLNISGNGDESLKDNIIVEENGLYKVNEGLYSGEDKTAGSKLEKMINDQPEDQQEDMSLNKFFTANGFNYDKYIKLFGESDNTVVQLKSLVAISQKIKAASVALLCKNDRRYSLEFSIGMNDNVSTLFRFNYDSVYVRKVFEPRKFLIMNIPLEFITWFKHRIPADDVKFIKCSMFIPVIFQGKLGTLFFGFPKEIQLTLEEIGKNLI
ncbi:MAG: cache domain-containing protein [Spirochaetales bacterium]|nr:cache domain-containing protein [Spirochaetales bacterium]